MKRICKVYKKRQLTIKEEFTDYGDTQPKNCINPFRNNKDINLCITDSKDVILRLQRNPFEKE